MRFLIVLVIRVLCIGNSFSWDAVEQELIPMCQEANVEVEIHNLYYGGCSLEQHARFMRSDSMIYSHRVCTNAVPREVRDTISLLQALQITEYDYISLQQASHDSGIRSSYEPWLAMLVDTIKSHQPQAQLCWMQTWAYSQDAKHPDYSRYNKDQQLMYDSIMACMHEVKKDYPSMLLIPCGTAIQLGRTTCMGDTFCRDGYHLNYSYGRYTASAVWYEFLTGKDVRHIRYKNAEMTSKQRRIAQRVAHQAMQKSKNAYF
mgnify:CR=1 FL=1